MALSWSVEKIEDNETVCFEWRKPYEGERTPDPEHLNENGEARYLKHATDALIWATISAKMGHITEDNVAEFAARCEILQDIDGPWLYTFVDGGKTDRRVTTEEIVAHVGLSTNVGNESRAVFLRSIVADRMDQIKHKAEKLQEERNTEEVAA